jgi:hypothetical protein
VRSFDWYWNHQLISKNQLGVVMNRGSLVLHTESKNPNQDFIIVLPEMSMVLGVVARWPSKFPVNFL